MSLRAFANATAIMIWLVFLPKIRAQEQPVVTLSEPVSAPVSAGSFIIENAIPLSHANLKSAPPTEGETQEGRYLPEYDQKEPRPLVPHRSLPVTGAEGARQWMPNSHGWAAPNFYHRPLYFEEKNLERNGHFLKSWKLQSALSAGRFFATAPLLPMKAWHRKPCERAYTLGHERPGNCNPNYVYRIAK